MHFPHSNRLTMVEAISMLALVVVILLPHTVPSLGIGNTIPLAPALYVFGDSLFDSGNNNFLPTIAKANFLPYGTSFAEGVTGRFTNGRTVPDFIAEYLRLPYPPAYMSMRESTPLTGLNYASATCGILPRTGSHMGKCLSLDDQINLFQHTIKSGLPKQLREKNEILSEYLSQSIFLVSVGSNDYINNYLNPMMFDTSKLYDPPEFARYLLDLLSRHFERLYNLGARKVVMFELGPIGCIPSIAKREKNQNRRCADGSNELVTYFNRRLPVTLRNLTSTLPGSVFAHGHAAWLGYDAIMNPSTYGLVDTGNPCCRTWGNGTSSCIPWLSPCLSPDNHYFYDGYHLTEAVYFIIAARCINDTKVCSPVIDDLLKM